MMLRAPRPLTRRGVREVVHVPVIASAAKVAGGLLLKKFAVSRVVQRLGAQRVLQELRDLNRSLQRQGAYSVSAADQADEGIARLSESVAGLTEQERVRAVWSWFDGLDKSHAPLANAIVKTYLETIPGVKWAGSLFRSTAKPEASDAATEAKAAPIASGVETEQVESLVKKMYAAHPEVRRAAMRACASHRAPRSAVPPPDQPLLCKT